MEKENIFIFQERATTPPHIVQKRRQVAPPTPRKDGRSKILEVEEEEEGDWWSDVEREMVSRPISNWSQPYDKSLYKSQKRRRGGGFNDVLRQIFREIPKFKGVSYRTRRENVHHLLAVVQAINRVSSKKKFKRNKKHPRICYV